MRAVSVSASLERAGEVTLFVEGSRLGVVGGFAVSPCRGVFQDRIGVEDVVGQAFSHGDRDSLIEYSMQEREYVGSAGFIGSDRVLRAAESTATRETPMSNVATPLHGN